MAAVLVVPARLSWQAFVVVLNTKLTIRAPDVVASSNKAYEKSVTAFSVAKFPKELEKR
jgi:hypothetical protein